MSSKDLATLGDTSQLVRLEGWLKQWQSGLFRDGWKRRWLFQEGDKLCIFASDKDLEHLGYVDLNHVASINPIENTMRQSDDDMWGFKVVEQSNKKHYFLAGSQEEMWFWITNVIEWVNHLERRFAANAPSGAGPLQLGPMRTLSMRGGMTEPVDSEREAAGAAGQPAPSVTAGSTIVPPATSASTRERPATVSVRMTMTGGSASVAKGEEPRRIDTLTPAQFDGIRRRLQSIGEINEDDVHDVYRIVRAVVEERIEADMAAVEEQLRKKNQLVEQKEREAEQLRRKVDEHERRRGFVLSSMRSELEGETDKLRKQMLAAEQQVRTMKGRMEEGERRRNTVLRMTEQKLAQQKTEYETAFNGVQECARRWQRRAFEAALQRAGIASADDALFDAMVRDEARTSGMSDEELVAWLRSASAKTN